MADKRKPRVGREYFERGEEDLKKGSVMTASDYFRKGAEQFDDGDCQYALGRLYILGELDLVDNPNIGLARLWLRKAESNGVSEWELFYLLGIAYLGSEKGVPADEKEASFWIEKAVVIKSWCYGFFGKAYYEGVLFLTKLRWPMLNIKKDYKKALEFCIEALKTDPDDIEINETVASIYYEGGYGVEKDYKKALFWSDKCLSKCESDHLNLKCIKIIMRVYKDGGFGMIQNISRAVEWCSKHGNTLALDAGLLYQFCIHPPDYKIALEWYERAVDGKNFFNNLDSNGFLRKDIGAHFKHITKEASMRIGIMHLKGLGVKKNYYDAGLWLSKADELYWTGYLAHYGVGANAVDYKLAFNCYREALYGKHHGKALNQLGILCQNGLGVPQSYRKAMEYFTSAAEVECSEAYNSLGDMFNYGYGIKIDYDKAFEWYTKAAEEPFDNNGQFNLGMMYLEGKGNEVNLELALYWFEKAQVFGNEQAHPSFISSIKTLLNVVRANNIPETQLRGYADVQIPTRKEPKQFFHLENHEQEDGSNVNSESDNVEFENAENENAENKSGEQIDSSIEIIDSSIKNKNDGMVRVPLRIPAYPKYILK